MTASERSSSQILDPDVTEEALGTTIDNIVPTHAYHEARVVGLGGSAGSIPALQRFFSAMPADSNMVFVVVLHLSPEHESVLAEVLQRCTSMPVVQASDGEAVAVNRVYVIPPAKHLTMTDGHLRLTELSREPGRRMTVDLFFRSLADSHGPHSVAIVLSGGDGDGAIGVKRIKERGGLTIAQDPEGAEHAGMPRAAIATTMVDWVLRAEDIPARLIEYSAREDRLRMPPEEGPSPVAPPADADADEATLRDILAFLRGRTGRDFSYYKRATIVRRIGRRMQVNEVDDLASYLTVLRTHPGEAGALLQDLLISVTNFFRDREAFAAIERLIPELFKNKTHADTVRVWVPACATGEEAYSLAMLLSEHARTLDAPPDLQVFATDLDEDVLLEARNGLYPESISTDVSVERLRRFFVKEHAGYRVRRELREVLLFAAHDLLIDSPFSRLDLVSCRNLLIYLNRGAQRRVLEIFHFALRPDGRLFLGTAEAVDDDSQLFVPVDKKHRIYARRGAVRATLPILPGPSTLARALGIQERGEVAIPKAALASFHRTGSIRSVAVEGPAWSEVHLKLIERFGPPSLIVNEDHDILHLSEGAAAFLQFAGGEPSTNLMKVVHPALRIELRSALFRTRQTGEVTLVQGIPVQLEDGLQLVDLRVYPASDVAKDFALVTFSAHPAPRAGLPARPNERDSVFGHLEQEREQTKRHLRDVVEQHDASTEQLKASNEELQAMNEELRSATEELESSREELQSVNEELTTVNQELKSKVDELGNVNSDLHNLMGATAIATVFLDRELRIMRFTPPALQLFSVISTDLGRPLRDLRHQLDYPELLADASRVLQDLVPVERVVPENSGRIFLARMLPYRAPEDRIAGVVLTFVDVTERQLAAQDAAQRARQELEVRVEERTSELNATNAALREEMSARATAEQARHELQRLLVSAQEQERSRISRELHDEVGQQISALMVTLKALERDHAAGPISTKLGQLRFLAERVGQEVHQLAYQLRPLALDELGLAGALSGLVQNWLSRTGLRVDLLLAGIEEARLPQAIETTVYRIVQEAMHNVHKHASAKNISVIVERRGDKVVAIIEDDGVGFELGRVEPLPDGSARIGLAGMRERAAIVGGQLTIESTPGAGTTVRVIVPVVAPS
jgi:two-component system, chemotaxis family, CheB/CheR fusion protein